MSEMAIFQQLFRQGVVESGDASVADANLLFSLS
jgi:hypothetical protein